MLKLLRKNVKLQTNQISIVDFFSLIQINLFISFTSFSFYLALITKKHVSIEKRICFKKDLLEARDQLLNNILVTYFLFHSYAEYGEGPFIPLKNKMFHNMTRSSFRFSYLKIFDKREKFF